MTDSLAALRDALRFSPNNVPLRQYIADDLLKHGKADEAETEYKTALTIAPEDIALKLGLARAYYQQGKDSAGVAIIEDILHGTSNSTILALYSRLLMRLGQSDLAIEQFRLATANDPEFDAFDPENISALYLQLDSFYGLNRLTELEAGCDRLLSIDPNHAPTYNLMGLLYQQRQQWAESIEFFKIALKIQPNLTSAHHNLNHSYNMIAKTYELLCSMERRFEQETIIKE